MTLTYKRKKTRRTTRKRNTRKYKRNTRKSRRNTRKSKRNTRKSRRNTRKFRRNTRKRYIKGYMDRIEDLTPPIGVDPLISEMKITIERNPRYTEIPPLHQAAYLDDVPGIIERTLNKPI